MGVKGLWKLLEPTGKAVSCQSLTGKVLAVDVSLWLHQLLKGMRDNKGQPIRNAHLIGLFKRICKLLFFGIKPIFVFDGSVPILKKQTIASRQKRRVEANLSSKHSLKKMLNKMLEKYALGNITGQNVNLEITKKGTISKKRYDKNDDDNDIFKLPTTEYPLMMMTTGEDDSNDIINNNNINNNNNNINDNTNHGEDEDCRNIHSERLNSTVDFDSDDFKSLPIAVKLEMLLEYKDKCKQTSWEHISSFPKKADDFSDYQLRRLMNINKITKHIESVRQDSNRGTATEFDCDGQLIYGVSHIASRDDVRFVYAKRKHDHVISAGGKRHQIDQDSHKNSLKKCNSFSYNNNVSNVTRNFVPYVLESNSIKDCYSSQIENKMNEKFLLPLNNMRSLSSVRPFSFGDMESKVRKRRFSGAEAQNDEDEEDDDAADDDDKDFSTSQSKDMKAEVATAEAASIDNDDEMCNNVREMINDVFDKAHPDDGSDKINFSAIEEKLSGELLKLREDRGKQERLATNINDQMNSEAQDLLRLFGVPFVVSPGEAEAQCAFLDRTGQTDGTISDDCDSFLFGARSVVKNLFSGDVAEIFRSRDIEERLSAFFALCVYLFCRLRKTLYKYSLKSDIRSLLMMAFIGLNIFQVLDQCQLICIGMLCGSDYTEGVRGVGPITAMEVIHEFKGQGLECLENFKQWWVEAMKQKKSQQATKESKVKTKLRQIHLNEGFPSRAVYEAYTNAVVDESMEEFEWGTPQFEELERYALMTLSWSKQQTDDLMIPLIKQLQSSKCPSKQKGMTDFFEKVPYGGSSCGSGSRKKIKSKRLRQVLNLKMTSSRQSGTTFNEGQSNCKRTVNKKTKKQTPKILNNYIKVQQEVNLSEESDDDDNDDDDRQLGHDDDGEEISDSVLASIDIDHIVGSKTAKSNKRISKKK
ncbi:hypothetical protein HELRODRAFT_188230 [Helobdella robusta]|uniref:XPG N-terminal domain-containing protein n=1 Tax=Helobdella robusta TaxID=6412 RepID=T1FPS7_HELRO|nr:hypothetical protein HELRODRAFT_188230 [Helobdella robusta]ESO05925.1 hypothetical protein HELRODRAFT_188230 [Helobdella robusta]